MDISVAIGRNVGEEPMSDSSWNAYQVCVWAKVRKAGFSVQVEENGHSAYWGNGALFTTEEECYRIIATIDDNLAPHAYLALRDDLDRVRKAWQQWGIALSMLKTDMVSDV